MKFSHVALLCCAAAFVFGPEIKPVHAKTAKACEAEWKANKPAIQARGTKKKDFISGCRAEADSSPTVERKKVTRSESRSTTGPTAKACEEQWKANKPSIQASGKRKKDFISECRNGTSTAAAPAKRENQSTAPSTNNSPRETTSPSARETRTPSTGTPAAANQYASEGAAKIRCPLDTIVWVNTKSGIYHFAGSKDYGGTRMGAYMCEKDTSAQGYRAAKNEKHP